MPFHKESDILLKYISRSYRVPGLVFPEKKIAIFNLRRAEIIVRTDIEYGPDRRTICFVGRKNSNRG